MLHRVLECRDFAGHAAGQRARLAERRVAPAMADKQIARGRRGRPLASVNGHDLSVRQPDEQEAAATDARVGCVHHPEREPHRHRRINGVAAGLENVEPRLCRERVD